MGGQNRPRKNSVGTFASPGIAKFFALASISLLLLLNSGEISRGEKNFQRLNYRLGFTEAKTDRSIKPKRRNGRLEIAFRPASVAERERKKERERERERDLTSSDPNDKGFSNGMVTRGEVE